MTTEDRTQENADWAAVLVDRLTKSEKDAIHRVFSFATMIDQETGEGRLRNFGIWNTHNQLTPFGEQVKALIPVPAPRDLNTGYLVDRDATTEFTNAMTQKMAVARSKGRGGWHDPEQCSVDTLAEQFFDHLTKGDIVDIGVYLAMLFTREGGVEALRKARKDYLSKQLMMKDIQESMALMIYAGMIRQLHDDGTVNGTSHVYAAMADDPHARAGDSPNQARKIAKAVAIALAPST